MLSVRMSDLQLQSQQEVADDRQTDSGSVALYINIEYYNCKVSNQNKKVDYSQDCALSHTSLDQRESEFGSVSKNQMVYIGKKFVESSSMIFMDNI